MDFYFEYGKRWGSSHILALRTFAVGACAIPVLRYSAFEAMPKTFHFDAAGLNSLKAKICFGANDRQGSHEQLPESVLSLAHRCAFIQDRIEHRCGVFQYVCVT